MGLIRGTLSALGAAGRDVRAEQFKEFFFCEALPMDVLMAKGKSQAPAATTGSRRSQREGRPQGNENIISNGSKIAVAAGQAMAIVEQGKVVEFTAEPGEFIWDSSTEPSVFHGGLGKGIINSFKTSFARTGFGGIAAKDQRVYYFNLREIKGNKYGTPQPIPFRVVDANINLDIDIAIRCNGEYSYKLSDPILFFTNVAGNVTDVYRRETIDSQLRSELLTALQPAFARISAKGIRYSALPGHTMEIAAALNEILSSRWGERRGIEIAEFGVNTVSASPEDEKMIRELQRKAVFRNTDMAAASLVGAQGDAMRAAAANQGGAMMGFLGLNAAMGAGGMNANQLFAMNAAQQQQQQQQMAPQQMAPQQMTPQAGGWTCACGAANAGRFCSGCGQPQPQPQAAAPWTCPCGANVSGNFCGNCGTRRA